MRIFVRIILVFCLFFGILALLGAGFFVATAGKYSVPDTIATDPTIPHVEIDGVVFHAETFGEPGNPVVVVVHGGPGLNYGYLLNLHELENDYFVVFYDQRGAGLSPRVDSSELSLKTSVADLHRIITHYGQGEPVHIVGHSWGAMLSAAYIGEHPDFVEKVVLAEPAELTHATPAKLHERMRASRDLRTFLLLVPTVFETFHMEPQDNDAIQDYIGFKMATQFVQSTEAGYGCADKNVEIVEPDVTVPPSRLGMASFEAILGESADLSQIAKNAHNYTDEVLFIASECSTSTGEALQRSQMQIFPKARLVVIPDAGHDMISENPDATLAAIREYFAH